MYIEELDEKAQAYKKLQEDINDRRNKWQTYVKPLLQVSLKQVAERFNYLDLSTQLRVTRQNHETVCLIFNPRPSGVFEQTEKKITSYIKEGSAIFFSQTLGGNVHVYIQYPKIKEIFTPLKEYEDLARVSIKEVDHSFIFDQVSTFLDKIIAFEDDLEGDVGDTFSYLAI